MSKWRHDNAQRKRHPRRSGLPAGVVPPLLPTLVNTVPRGDRWLHEIKWDGYRISAYVDHGRVRIFTRNLNDWTDRFPTIVDAVGRLPVEQALIDGEAIVFDERGLPSFSALQMALGIGCRVQDIQMAAFDLLMLDGEELVDRRLEERRLALVRALGAPLPRGLIFSEEVEGDADQVFSHACQHGLEGVVSKLRDSVYRSGRRAEWVKTKCILTDDFIAIGYEPGKGFGGLGKVLLARVEDGELVYAGGVGTGFNTETGMDLRRRLDAIAIDHPPIPG
jgi:bifunctional non-homologous end joining protein LigD